MPNLVETIKNNFINNNMKKLYKFYWDCGRQGDIESIFIATEKDIKANIGEEVYFGEILGKHSEIYGILEEGSYFGDSSLLMD